MFCWTSNSAAGDGLFFSYSDILVPMNSFSRMESHFELQSRFMHSRINILLCVLALTASGAALPRQQSPSSQTPAPAKSPAAQQKKPAAPAAPAAQTSPKPKSAPAPAEPQDAAPNPDAELQATVQQAGNDRAALIRNLEAYLAKYPDSPRRVAIYRGLLESEIQLQNQKRALEYAEQIIAIQPEDSQTLFLAASLLEKMPDDTRQVRAMGYDTHLIELVA